MLLREGTEYISSNYVTKNDKQNTQREIAKSSDLSHRFQHLCDSEHVGQVVDLPYGGTLRESDSASKSVRHDVERIGIPIGWDVRAVGAGRGYAVDADAEQIPGLYVFIGVEVDFKVAIRPARTNARRSGHKLIGLTRGLDDNALTLSDEPAPKSK